MPSFDGRLTEDGRPVSQWLTFKYTAVQIGNFTTHPGTVDLPEGVYIKPGAYAVELRAGGNCSILVDAVHDASHGRRHADFNINGPPPALHQ
jgi:hypothetical protein